MRKKGLFLFFPLIVILIAFGLGFYVGKLQVPPAPIEGVCNQTVGEPQDVDFSLFWDAWRVLEQNFFDSEKINYQDMIYGAISGMVKSLKDPYTVYMPPEDAKIFKDDVSGEFQGVGMEIGIRQGTLTVIAPLEGTPAQRAGLRPGDKIIKVDDVYVADITVDEAVKLIRGEKGTKVVLTIMRDTFDQVKDFEIIREVIEIPSIKWEVKEEDIAYIKLYNFSEAGGNAFKQVGMEIMKSPTKKIIFDLRNNPGGYLEVAQDITGWFLEKGQVVTIEDFGGKKDNKEYKANGSGQFVSYPIVILINQGSASASEILAGALRDQREVQLIGAKSFGKGSVQTLEELKSGSLKITVAKWLTPNGQTIDGEGLVPDIEIELSEEDYNNERDPQLEKAIEIIREMR
ncbi:MAG: S41 family peptidase [Candidatus Nealsonbacteria bacterium]|nr:S41 family peptidase [Candidatus Nealsonbacteria bacterium]